ncbi:acetylornithine deacetylase [Klebsiella pneumoniae]|uniref:Acetylornithine deacetylase n=1 Tax=Klebsiella pneumoniae TaxID=573 RepID=A0A447RGW0_KLEPN|nr:acetylornithine deacetylase [Klebsiella pneumoniae]
MTATLELARQLLGFNTINPPGSRSRLHAVLRRLA